MALLKRALPYDSLTAFSFCGLFALLHGRVLSLVLLQVPVLWCHVQDVITQTDRGFAYLSLYFLAFIIKSLILLELLIIFAWGKKRIKFHGLACECPMLHC